MGSSKKVTVGHKYYMGQHQVLCHGPIDYISRITFDADKVAWAGRNTGGTLTVVADSLFGGDDGEGGASGQIDLMMGRPAQTQNSYLQAILGSVIPAFRGVVSVAFKQFYFGNSAYLKNVAFRGTRTNVRDEGAAQWYLPTASIFSGNLEQPHAIYIAIDRSGSMDTIGGGPFDPSINNQTRLANAKTAINTTLDYIAGALISDPLDICVVAWGAGNSSITRRSAGASDITAIKNWVNALTASGGTDFTQAFNDMNGFFAGASSAAKKFAFFITDGLPDAAGQTSLENAEAAADIVNAQSVPVYAVNIDLDDTQYTEIVDNTASDGVPIITGGMPAALVQVLMAQLDFQVDMNPAHMLRECNTSTIFGLGLSDSNINDAAFIDVANHLYDERMGMSLLWDSDSMGLDDLMDEICRHIDASHYTDQNGLATLKLIRSDYNIEDLIMLDESNVLNVDNAASTPSTELVNSVTGIYWDPKTGKNAAVTVSDPALVQMQGRIKSTTLQYPAFTDPGVVARKLSSDLRSLSNSLFSCTIIVNRVPEGLNIGEPFIFNWPELKQYNTVMRVADIDWGDGRNNDIRISCTQDVFAVPDFPVVTPSPGWENPSQPPAPSPARLIFELPYYELVQAQGQSVVDVALAANPELAGLGVAAIRPSSNAINARIAINAGAGFEETSELLDFCPSFTLVDAIDRMEDEITFEDGVDLDQIVLGTVAQMDTELVAITAIDTTLNTATLKRAVLDSVPVEHDAGTRLFFWDQFVAGDTAEYVEGETLDVRVMPITSSGQLDLGSAPTDELTMVGRAIRPFPPGDLKLNGSYFPATLTGDVAVTYESRNRTQQTGGTLIGFTDASVTPEAGTTYEIELYDVTNNNLIISYTAISVLNKTILDADFGGKNLIRMKLRSRRTGYASYQEYVHEFTHGTIVNDPYWRFIALLLHFNGADNSTTITDEMERAWSITGNPKLKTASPKFGTASALFDGTGYISTLVNLHNFQFGTQDFTVECFVKCTTFASYKCLFDFYKSGVNGSWQVGISSAGKLTYYEVNNSGTAAFILTGSITVNTNVWVHVAVVRESGVLKFYVDGVADGSIACTTNYQGEVDVFAIGGQVATRNTAFDFVGNIDEARIYNGRAAYTAAFTPPAAELLPPADNKFGYVVSQLHFNGVNASTVVSDESLNPRTYAANGNAQLSTSSPKFGSAAAVFDGTGDWFETTANINRFRFGTGDFTLECFVNLASRATDSVILDCFVVGASGWQVYVTATTGKAAFYSSSPNGTLFTSTTTVANSSWHHIAVTRQSGTVRLFVDGNLEGTVTDTRNYTGTASVFSIGAQVSQRNSTYDTNGKIDEVRIMKGHAKYTASFTAPSAEFVP